MVPWPNTSLPPPPPKRHLLFIDRFGRFVRLTGIPDRDAATSTMECVTHVAVGRAAWSFCDDTVISVFHYSVYTGHVTKLSLLLMPSVVLYLLVCHVFYCEVSGRLVLLLLKN